MPSRFGACNPTVAVPLMKCVVSVWGCWWRRWIRGTAAGTTAVRLGVLRSEPVDIAEQAFVDERREAAQLEEWGAVRRSPTSWFASRIRYIVRTEHR